MKPRKYQYQKGIPAETFDAVEVIQTDTGAAKVQRPVVVLGDGAEGGAVIDKQTFTSQTECLLEILEELKKMNHQLSLVTGIEL